VWGPIHSFDSFLSAHLDKIAYIQDKLAHLEEPQVELGVVYVMSWFNKTLS